MMNEAWIEQSLARLEALETQQSQYEAAGQVAPPELVEEIQTLYEALDAAADGDAAPAQPAGAPMAQPPMAQPPIAQAPMAQAPYSAEPLGAAAGAPAFAGPAVMPSPMQMSDYADFDDQPPKSKAGLMALAAVLVVGLGAGGWYMTMGPGATQAAPPPAAVGEAKVISASAVPEDTQEPQVAKGGEATRTLGTKFEEGDPEPARPSGNRSTSNTRPKSTAPKKKDDGRKIKLDDARDPLAGLD